jgi:EAL domain-containing protein (putative c-di-GMP-specific phosphodiesterase class I)
MLVGKTDLRGIGLVAMEAHFQRKVMLNDRTKVVGYEALLRGRGPNGKIMGPGAVFARISKAPHAEAEAFRRMIAIEMLRKATRACNALKAGVAVNVTPDMLIDSALLTAAIEFKQGEFPVTLEILEPHTKIPFGIMAEGAATLKRAGFKLSLDDFGTVASNLLRLARIEADEVKIDAALLDTRRGQLMLPHVVRLIKEMGAQACIEGIETEAHHQIAIASGADTAQGYLYGPPGPIRGL